MWKIQSQNRLRRNWKKWKTNFLPEIIFSPPSTFSCTQTKAPKQCTSVRYKRKQSSHGTQMLKIMGRQFISGHRERKSRSESFKFYSKLKSAFSNLVSDSVLNIYYTKTDTLYTMQTFVHNCREEHIFFLVFLEGNVSHLLILFLSNIRSYYFFINYR